MRHIDCDTHVFEPIEVYADYLDPKLRDRAPRFYRDGERLMLAIEDQSYPTVPGHPGLGNTYGEESKVDKSGNDPTVRLQYMDETDVALQVVFPTLGMNGFSSVKDPELAAGFARAYNRYMAEFCATDSARLIGAVMMPMNHPERAVAELEHAVAAGGRIAFTNPTPPDDIPWSDPRYDVVWQALEDRGIPLMFHEVSAGCPKNAIGINRYTFRWQMVYLCTHVIEAELALTDMILGGVLERFDRLRVGLAEAHVAWLPGWLRILDDNFGLAEQVYGSKSGSAELSMKPSDYYRRQCVVAAFSDDSMIHEALELGEDNIVVCSDWPHPNSRPLRELDDRDDVSSAEVERLVSKNPQLLLGLAS